MIIVMQAEATQSHISSIVTKAEALKLSFHLNRADKQTSIGIVGDGDCNVIDEFSDMKGVEKIVKILHPHKLASREFHPSDSVVSVDGVRIGSGELIIIAGPCSVESRNQMLETAYAVKEAGANALRGGIFKPRTSPYSFLGLGIKGLEYLAEAKENTGLPIVTEVLDPEQLTMVLEYVDVVQIGARNMQNYSLLHAVGECHKPALLKRGMMATVKELLMSAEYILSHGNNRVILCERGIRTFETTTRNTTDINAIPVLKSQTHLPVILDPSHSTGKRDYVSAIARAGVAAGANGLIIEVHPRPNEALSDGPQSLKPAEFAQLVLEVRAIAEVERVNVH